MSTNPAERAPTYAELQEENTRLREQVGNLYKQLRELKRYVFGRRSEKLSLVDARQEVLFDTPPEQELTEDEEPEVEVSPHTRRRGRKALPADLPRERIEYEPEEIACPCCGMDRDKIGEEITEELDYVPARFVVREHVKIKRACRKCKDGVVIGKLSPETQVIEGGRPGAGLLTHIFVSKYCDHIPLHRQEQIFARHGIELPRQRMCDWIGKVVEQGLMPIAQELKRTILISSYIRADETELEVQTEEKDGKLHKGYLWGALSLEGDVHFEYSPSRAGKVAEELYRDFKGFLQTDLYAGYSKVYVPECTVRVGCLAHVRRRFIKAEETTPRESGTILKKLAELYQIEKQARELSFDERRLVRQRKSKKLFQSLEVLLRDLQLRVLPKTPLREAIDYALSQWEALVLPLEHGMLELDNNAIERQIRPIAVGRHNWLFAGNERGAKWAACLFSLIATCKLNRVNPYEYLHDVIRRYHITSHKRIADLTPRRWKSLREHADTA